MSACIVALIFESGSGREEFVFEKSSKSCKRSWLQFCEIAGTFVSFPSQQSLSSVFSGDPRGLVELAIFEIDCNASAIACFPDSFG